MFSWRPLQWTLNVSQGHQMTDSPQEQSTTDGKAVSESGEEKPPHPVAAAIDRLVHRARDIKLAVRQFMPIAQEMRKQNFDQVIEVIDANSPLIDDSDPHTRVLAQKKVHEAMTRFYRLRNSHVPSVIENGLFLALFSAF